jgi:quercetin dioxygenase-like cupin family protein
MIFRLPTKLKVFPLVSSLLLTLGVTTQARAHQTLYSHDHTYLNRSLSIPSTQSIPKTDSKPVQVSGNADSPVILPNLDRQGFWIFSDNAQFIATEPNTAGQFSLFDFTTLPGGPIPHFHTREDEFVFLLDGAITYQREDQLFTANPGTFISKPKNILHAFVNEGITPARHIEFVIPSGIEGLFQELGTPGGPTEPPPPQPPTPEVLERVVQVFNDFGVRAPETLIFSPVQFNSPKQGTPEVTILRHGEIEGSASAKIIVSSSDGANASQIEISVNFGEGERIKTIPITGIDTEGIFELTLTDPLDTAIGPLQNKAKLVIEQGNTFTLSNGYTPDDFPQLLPDPQQESFLLGDAIYKSIATSDQTQSLLSLFDVSVPSLPSEDETPLTNPAEIVFYTLEGQVTFDLGSQSFTVDPNTFVLLPKETPYSLGNFGISPARTLAFAIGPGTNPSVFENYIKTQGQLLASIPESSFPLGLLTFGALALGWSWKSSKNLD